MKNKVVFFIRASDKWGYDKIIYNLSQLIVPEGISVDIITLEEDFSTDFLYKTHIVNKSAKYKIYLNSNIEIENPNFIMDFIEIFTANEDIAVIGMSGADNIPASGILLESAERYGVIKITSEDTPSRIVYWENNFEKYKKVNFVDPWVVITQYDILKDEKIEQEYDYSMQSYCLECRRRGYVVAVAKQKEPWIKHLGKVLVNIEQAKQSKEMVFKKYAQEMNAIQDKFLSHNLLKQIFLQYDCFCFHQGLGETCIFGFLFGEYKRIYKKPILIFTVSNSRKIILQACPAVDQVINISKEEFFWIQENFPKIKNTLNLYYINYPKEINSMKEKICAYLNVGIDSSFDKFTIPSALNQSVLKKIHSLNIPMNKIVLIVPFAICYGENVVPRSFWGDLVLMLKNKGYFPIFNHLDVFIENVPSLFLEIDELISFVSLCGNVIGVRTGLLDVIAAFSDIRIQVIYPGRENSIWDENMGLKEIVERVGRENIADYIFEEDDLFEILSNSSYANIKKYLYNNNDNEIINAVGEFLN